MPEGRMLKKNKNNKIKIKTCPLNPSHIWIADIPYCPYCAFTPKERINWMKNQKPHYKESND